MTILGFFGGEPAMIVHVRPELVIEIDMAHQSGRYRNAVRYSRVRPDLHVSDLTPSHDNPHSAGTFHPCAWIDALTAPYTGRVS